MEDRLFGLDVQLLFDAFVLFVVIMIMYAIMSRLFFKPVRAFLEQRKQAVAADRDEAQQDVYKRQKLSRAKSLVLQARMEAANQHCFAHWHISFLRMKGVLICMAILFHCWPLVLDSRMR